MWKIYAASKEEAQEIYNRDHKGKVVSPNSCLCDGECGLCDALDVLDKDNRVECRIIVCPSCAKEMKRKGTSYFKTIRL